LGCHTQSRPAVLHGVASLSYHSARLPRRPACAAAPRPGCARYSPLAALIGLFVCGLLLLAARSTQARVTRLLPARRHDSLNRLLRTMPWSTRALLRLLLKFARRLDRPGYLVLDDAPGHDRLRAESAPTGVAVGRLCCAALADAAGGARGARAGGLAHRWSAHVGGDKKPSRRRGGPGDQQPHCGRDDHRGASAQSLVGRNRVPG
jgi:hypothetical protein